jgi:addiction module RelE/StbE family toxin
LKIRFTPESVEDLRSIHVYVAHFDERAADKIIARIDTAISFLGEFPEMGREGRIPDTRELVVPDTNYIVVYSIPSALDVFILTIVHGREQFPRG